MILEVALLDVRPDMQPEFEQAFQEAQAIIGSMKGYVSHQLHKCLEKNNRYILLVNWDTLKDHTEGFRKSPEYQQWKNQLHRFYDPFPEVEHYQYITGNEMQ